MSANFPFQENIDVFAGEKTDKEYWLKISSKDATAVSPFDFTVKFNMNTSNANNYTIDADGNKVYKNFSYNKEANIGSKYNEIKRLEVTDIVIPRYIPDSTIGLNFDGVNLVKNNDPSGLYVFTLALYPGVTQKIGTDYIKLTNYKECIIVTDISNSAMFLDDLSGSSFRYKNDKIIDHININNYVYPIISVSGNTFMVDNLNQVLPTTTKFVMGNYYSNLIYIADSSSYTLTASSILINGSSTSIYENIYSGNIIRVTDASSNSYFNYSSQSTDSSGNTTLFGSWIAGSTPTINGVVNTFLFGFGMRDLIDQRIFYLELDPFVPVKSSATDNKLDKMFGVLFPSTQSKDWAYLSGEPRECFLPRDLRKLDKFTIRIYDSEGKSLNDIFLKRPGLLNSNYFPNMYTTMIIKVDEIDKSLVAKKMELPK